MRRSTRNRLSVAFGAVVGIVLLSWLALQESATEGQIRIGLGKLQAAGEPTTAIELGTMFPNPSPTEDAGILFGPLFNVVTNSRSIRSNPVSFANWTFTRTQSLDAAVLQELERLVIATRDVTKLWPSAIPPGTRFPMHWERGMTNSTFINFIAARSTIQLLVAHAAYSAETGNSDAAAASLIKGFQFSRTLNSEAMMVMHMIRHSFERGLCETTESCLNKMPFSAARLQQLDDAVELERPGAWSDALRAEHCMGLWAFDYLKNGGSLQEVFGSSEDDRWWKRLAGWFDSNRDRRPKYSDADYLLYVRTIPERIEIAEMFGHNAPSAAEDAGARYLSNSVSQAGSAANPIFSSQRTVAAHLEASARLVTLKTALALERSRAFKKEPEKLEDLVPDYLATVPRDTFNQQPLRFKKLPRGYIIYSVGADGVDNGGTERTNSNMTTNYDVTFTVER